LSEDLSHQPLGDMLDGLIEELDERVSLDPETRRIVLIAVVLAANNGRIIGANEVIAQAIQQGIDFNIQRAPGEQAPSTLAQALGEADGR
jgi:hypothetical protein